MSHFDYVIVALIAASGLVGFVRGLIKEFMSLVAFIAAFAAALWWGPEAATWLDTLIANSLLRSALAYAVIFILSLLAAGLINTLLSSFIARTGLSPADHGLGMLFGLARGGLIIIALVIIAGYTQLPEEPWWLESHLVKKAIDIIISIKAHLPADVASWLPY